MTDWGQCSAPCGPGYKSRSVVCSSSQEQDCSAHQKPPTVIPCDNGPCQTYSWFATEWSEQCSEDCGMGIQTRKIHCSAGPDKEHLCDTTIRPATSRSCSSDKDCTAKWFTGPWSPCSEACGHGKQSRQVVCMKRVRNENVLTLESQCPPQDRPISQKSCQLMECSQWYTSDWSSCSMPCDTGVQKREIQCLSNNEQPSTSCDVTGQPSTRRPCNTHSCSAQSDVSSDNNLGDQAPTQIDLQSNTLYDSECSDKFKNCHLVVQARLCKFKYYHQSCCQACRTRSLISPPLLVDNDLKQ